MDPLVSSSAAAHQWRTVPYGLVPLTLARGRAPHHSTSHSNTICWYYTITGHFARQVFSCSPGRRGDTTPVRPHSLYLKILILPVIHVCMMIIPYLLINAVINFNKHRADICTLFPPNPMSLTPFLINALSYYQLALSLSLVTMVTGLNYYLCN